VIQRKPKGNDLLSKTLVGVVAHDHFSKDCPDAKDASGTNLVSMVSLVIPHDTLDNDDSLTFDNEDTSLSESKVTTLRLRLLSLHLKTIYY
jgi:hypothetical protein